MSSLIDLDFAPGIRADDINANFKTLQDWLKSERLHSAGWGLIAGFEIKADPKTFTVTVSEGKMVNSSGDEIDIPEYTFPADTMPVISKKEVIIIPENGTFRLKAVPFSKSKMSNLKYRPPRISEYPAKEEFYMEDRRIGVEVPPLNIDGNKIIVDAGWAGHEITIEYDTTESRIDSILLDDDGVFHYEKSVASTNPSHVDLSDYKNMFMLGAVYWKSGDSVSAEVYNNHRSYRTVYVDQDNDLWLRGEKYRRNQIIYFDKPDPPSVKDIWFDEKNNRLMMYRNKDGLLGWYAMNEHTSMPVRERKSWNETNFPLDRQTFKFEDELNMRFVPDTNALEIVIDNHPVMSDQFIELTLDKPEVGTASGIGFKMIEPLDHEANVEVVVTHRVRSEPATELFQRGAVFVKEGLEAWSAKGNPDKIFVTRNVSFELGEEQLEVFLNGLRLDRGKDYVELIEGDNGTFTPADLEQHPEQKGIVCRYFQVLREISDTDIVTHKVSKYVWSYDQLQKYVTGIKENAERAIVKAEKLEKEFTTFQSNISARFNELEKNLAEIQSGVKAMISGYMKKNDVIGLVNLDVKIKDKLVGSHIEEIMEATALHPIQNCGIDDVISVFYIDGADSHVLIKDTEYTALPEGKDLRISLKDYLIKESAEIYVTGFRTGAE